MKLKFLFMVSIPILFSVAALAQQPTASGQPPTHEEKLNRVFQEWERPDRPGCVAAVSSII